MATGKDIKYSIGADSSQLITELTRAQAKIKEMSRAMKDKQTAGSEATDMFGRMGTALRGLVAGAVVMAIGKFVEFAGKVDSVTRAYQGLAAGVQGGSQALLSSISTAARGTMSQLDIMERSNLALQLMGEEVADKLPQMAEIALATARATGRNVSDAYNDIIVAAGRGSVLILDNLGISSENARRYMNQFAASLGKTTEQLTESEKKQAFFNAVLRAGNDLLQRTDLSVLTLGERIQILKAQAEDMATTFARRVAPALNEVMSTLTRPGEDAGGSSITDVFAEMAQKAVIFVALVLEALRSLGDYWDMLWGTIANRFYTALQWMISKMRSAAESLGMNDVARQLLGAEVALDRQAAFAQDRVNQAAMSTSVQRVQELQRMLRFGIPVAEGGGAGGRRGPGPADQAAAGGGRGARQRELQLSEYYDYLGMMMEAELEKENERAQKLLEIENLTQEQRTAIQEAHERRRNEIMQKYDVFRRTMVQETTAALTAALNQFESSTKDALKETLFGDGGWGEWRKKMKEMLQQLVVDLMWATAKALALKAVTGSITGTSGSEAGLISAVVSKMFAKGNVPVLAGGRVPVLAGGNIPSGHELVWMDYRREAVINAQSTRKYNDLLRSINNNPNGGAGGVTQHISFSGNVMSQEFIDRVVIPKLQDAARRQGTDLFRRQGV